MLHLDPSTARSMDALSITAIASAMAGWIPTFVALIPAVYYLIQIYETETVQKWLERRREHKALKRRLAASMQSQQQPKD